MVITWQGICIIINQYHTCYMGVLNLKTKILIIEDNAYKSFTTKQLIEAKLRLAVRLVDVASTQELARRTVEFAPHQILCCSDGGAEALLLAMTKRQSNRRNTEITLLLTPDLDTDQVALVRRFVTAYQQADARPAKDKKLACHAA